MAWPGHVEGGKEIAQLTQNIDFAPTFLALAGAPVPTGMHGQSLVPLLEGKATAWRDAIYYHYYESQATHMVPAMYGVRTDRYKLVRYYEPQWNSWELFDLLKDPDELRDVSRDPQYADVRAALAKRLQELRAQYHDDTGDFGDGAFPLTAGVTRVAREDGGLRVWANTGGGYLLTREVPAGKAFVSTLRPLPGKPQKNGYLVFAGDDERGAFVRAGIEFGARKLVVLGPGAGRAARHEVAIEWDGTAALELRVTVDLAAHRITAEAAGVRVEAALPAAWTKLSAYGYGASNAETWFREIAVK